MRDYRAEYVRQCELHPYKYVLKNRQRRLDPAYRVREVIRRYIKRREQRGLG